MKQKTPTGLKVIRGVSIAITLTLILILGTVFYSAYQDWNAVKSELSGPSPQATGRAVMQGASEVVSINITVPNKGLYALNVTVSCTPQANIVCSPAQVNVPAGEQGMLRFRMTIVDVAQYASSSNHRIDGTVAIQMVPFASLGIGVDLGGFVHQGGQ
ncbi:MAG: hypothetical protein OK452_03840 [Thaumarchaeota archaeon]|nr:hypothetical protein [Nitrososphaerota archaeon]